MYQNNIYFFIFKKLFLISAHQNDKKYKKNIKKQINKIEILILFQKHI